jgi:hypothetical protein
MFNVRKPISTTWEAGAIHIDEILYEIDRPTIFTAKIGIFKVIFLKKDELEESDLYVVCQTDNEEIELLKNGKVSVRGILSYKVGWIIETDLSLNVLRFQETSHEDLERLLPPKGVGLLSKYAAVPDSIGQAQAFMAFKFSGHALSSRSMPLSVFRDLIDGISNLVRQALVPDALSHGRDARFFDVQIGQPQFASLLVTIKSADIDEKGLKEYKRTKNLVPESLRQASNEKGLDFWQSIEHTSSLANHGELSRETSEQYHDLLGQIVGILPSEDNDLDRLEVTFHGSKTSKIISIDKKSGDRLIRAHQFEQSVSRSISGNIIEVNGEAQTFIIKSGDRLTTCAPSSTIFEQMDKDNIAERGISLRLVGTLWRRTRRDYLTVTEYPEVVF